MLPSRINLVTLGVEDLERSSEFYQQLGWKESSVSNPAIRFLQSQGTLLSLYGRTALAEDVGIEAGGNGFRGLTLSQNLESPDAVDAAFAHAIACGAQAVKKPQKVFWGGYSGYFADPDGHLWELAHNPLLPLNGQGYMELPD